MNGSPAQQSEALGTVLVTGGSRGIGRAVCLEFGRAGWRVGVHYRERQAEAEETAALVRRAGGDALPCRADVREFAQVEAMVQGLLARWGVLDVLVCGAGQAASRLALKTSPDEWQAIIHTNLTGTFHCLKAVGPGMIERRSGAVVVIGSFAALQGRPGQAAYATSKAGLLGLVKTTAKEWGRHNVRVNLLLPGWQRTELAGRALPEDQDLGDHSLGCTVPLEDVARTVFHLAAMRGTSGQVWNLDSRIV
ncbi:SDR family NAD(P)-dependent oxidoreductase [Nitrospira sp. Kam-Ns4a]